MSTKAIYDLAVKTGEYIDAQGMTKGRYVNIGRIMKKDDGGSFVIMERTFNAAGVPNPENRSTFIASLFPVERKEQQQAPIQPSANVNQQAQQYQAAKNGDRPTLADINNDNLDELPF